MRWPWHRHKHCDEEFESPLEALREIACDVHAIRRIIASYIDGLTVVVSGEQNMTLTALAKWSDGTTGFDATHVQPADWHVTFSEASGDATLTDNGDGTASVSAGTQDSSIVATYDAFSVTTDIPAAAPTITGLVVNES